MPLLNLGYALGGLTGGYNQAQSQAMQRAAYQLALQQAQSQQNAQRLAGQALAAGLLGKGGGLGGLGGGFNPQNIQPVSAPAPIPGVTTPSPAPPPPAAQQPPPADPAADYRPMTPQQWTEASPDTQVRDAVLTEEGVTATSEDRPPGPQGAVGPPGPQGQSSASAQRAGAQPFITSVIGQADTAGTYIVRMSDGTQRRVTKEELEADSKRPVSGATSASPVTTTPDTKPAPGPASDTKPSTTTPSATTAPASTTSDASGGAGGGDSYAVKIPGGPSIPLSTFFDTIDYSHLAQGIAKLAPPGTDQADIYQAVVDLSKLAEGNRTQQQQAGLILRELIKQPFDLEKIDRRAAAASGLETQRQAGRTELETQREGGRSTLETQRQSGRTELETRREAFRAESQQRSRDFQVAQQQRRFDNQTLQRIDAHAQKMEDEATKRGLDAPKRQAQLIRQEINSYVNRYVDLTSPKTPQEVKDRVSGLIQQLDRLNTQLFNTPSATP